MKKGYLGCFLLVIIIFYYNSLSAQNGGVTIGANRAPDKSAVLELQSDNKGFLPPRVTSSQRNNIKSPAAGLIVYDTDAQLLYLFDGIKWKALTAVDGKFSDFQSQPSLSATSSEQVSTSAIDPNAIPPYGTTVYDSSLGKLLVSDGNVMRDGNTGCLPSYLKKIVYTRPGSTATSLDPAGSLKVFSPNQIRNLHDPVTGNDLGYAVEANDTTLIYQSEVLTDQTNYNGTIWNADNVSVLSSGTLAGRPRFLITKTDANSWKSYRKSGLRLNYNTSYFISVIVQRKSCNAFRMLLRSDGAGKESYVTLDLTNGDITDGGSLPAGVISNVRGLPLKGVAGAWLFMFNFVPNTQGFLNTTHQLRLVPYSSTTGDAIYVAAPLIIKTTNTWSSYIIGDKTVSIRGQESLKLDLGLQTSGTVLVKTLMNDQKTLKNRAVTWLSSSGTGLSLTGAGFKGGYAIAENGVLVEAGGDYLQSSPPSGGNKYYIDPTAPVGGDGTIDNPYNSFFKLPIQSGNLNGTHILFKRGTKWRGYVELKGCSNFTIDSYGSGNLPIIDASDITGTWTQENTVWYISGHSVAQTIFVNDQRLVGVSSKDQLINNIRTSWFDPQTQRIYIHLATDINPNLQITEHTARIHSLYLLNCTNFYVRNMQFQKARNCGVFITGRSPVSKNSVVERCIAINNGAFDRSSNLAGDGFGWYDGVGNTIRQCISTYNVNVAYEFASQDSLKMEDNMGSRCGNGIELWGAVTNSTFHRNRIINIIPEGISWGHGNGFWMANSSIQPGITGGHNNNKIISNVFATTFTEAIDIEAGTHEIIGNLFFDPVRSINDAGGSFVVTGKNGGSESINVCFKNNIFYQPKFKTSSVGTFNIDHTTDSAFLNNNCYYSENGSLEPIIYKGVNYGSSLSKYQTASGQDLRSLQTDPMFTNVTGKVETGMFVTLANGSNLSTLVLTDENLSDFHLSAKSPINNAGDSLVSGTHISMDFSPYGTSRPIGPCAVVSGSPLSLGDSWIGGLKFRGGSLHDVQVSKGSLSNTEELVRLTLCK